MKECIEKGERSKKIADEAIKSKAQWKANT